MASKARHAWSVDATSLALDLAQMLSLAQGGIERLFRAQADALGEMAYVISQKQTLVIASNNRHKMSELRGMLGDRFRLIVNTVETIEQPHALPKLPVARAVWKALPNLDVAAEAWILAGAAHHSVYSQAITPEYLRIMAEIFGIEFLLIDGKTEIPAFKNEINWNDLTFSLRR